MSAAQLLSNYDISTTTTGDLLALRRNGDIHQIWFWKVTMPSGTGANAVKIELEVAANWENDSASREFFSANSAALWLAPVLITSQMITDAGGTLRIAVPNPAVFDRARLKFTYSGAGSRVFRFNLYVGGAI